MKTWKAGKKRIESVASFSSNFFFFFFFFFLVLLVSSRYFSPLPSRTLPSPLKMMMMTMMSKWTPDLLFTLFFFFFSFFFFFAMCSFHCTLCVWFWSSDYCWTRPKGKKGLSLSKERKKGEPKGVSRIEYFPWMEKKVEGSRLHGQRGERGGGGNWGLRLGRWSQGHTLEGRRSSSFNCIFLP
jgi:hypothetical protein